MIKELFSQMFRFGKLGSLDKGAIALVGVSVVLVTLVMFLIRYIYYYGILKSFGMSLACGAVWAVIASAVVTSFSDQPKIYVIMIVGLLLVWLIIALILVIKKPYFNGMTWCVITAALFLLAAIVLCVPVKGLEKQIVKLISKFSK